jgi:hypothetical protein
MKALLSVFWACDCETLYLNLEKEYKLQVFKTNLSVKYSYYIELRITLLDH